MANLFDNQDRRVLPNWRSFGKTSVLGELNSINLKKDLASAVSGIEEYVIDWQLNRSISHAADLLGAALVNNQKEDKNVLDAAQYIISNQQNASSSQISVANKILNNVELDLSTQFKEINLDTLPTLINPTLVHHKIKETKRIIRLYPYNSILYVELSRYYSILGHESQAISAMKTALHLAPNNRFVLRAATRLFVHYNDDKNDNIEYIHNILRKNPITNFDPWLTSAEISIATIRNRTSKFMKRGMEMVNSRNISPFNFTELASSIGTVELLSGSNKKSRDFFTKSLIKPNDNSLAQMEWASTKDKQINVDPTGFGVSMNFEALALDSYHSEDFDIALDNAARWFIDMPFSKRPIMFGSNLASTILKDQDKAISFLNAGLISHPNDPQLLNNLAYALSLDNKAIEALEHLNKIKSDTVTDEVTQICLKATRGLAYFRSGFTDLGRDMYLEAIELTKSYQNQDLNYIAFLNYAREEILIGSEFVESIMDNLSKVPSDSKDIKIRTLRNDIIELHNKFKEGTTNKQS